MTSNEMNKKKSILFNTKEKCKKIRNIEVVEELKYLGGKYKQRERFKGQKN